MEILAIKILFAFLAAFLAILGNVSYLVGMFKGRVRPHPYTWFVWSIISGTVFVGQVVKGAGWATLPFAVSEIFTIIIFLYSLKFGFRNIKRTDTYFLIAALLGIIPWFMTNDPTISVIIMVTIDLIAFIPTLSKAWNHPETESAALYSSNVARHSFALVALSSYNIATTFHSIAMIITNTIMTSFVLRKKLLKIHSIFYHHKTKNHPVSNRKLYK